MTPTQDNELTLLINKFNEFKNRHDTSPQKRILREQLKEVQKQLMKIKSIIKMREEEEKRGSSDGKKKDKSENE